MPRKIWDRNAQENMGQKCPGKYGTEMPKKIWDRNAQENMGQKCPGKYGTEMPRKMAPVLKRSENVSLHVLLDLFLIMSELQYIYKQFGILLTVELTKTKFLSQITQFIHLKIAELTLIATFSWTKADINGFKISVPRKPGVLLRDITVPQAPDILDTYDTPAKKIWPREEFIIIYWSINFMALPL